MGDLLVIWWWWSLRDNILSRRARFLRKGRFCCGDRSFHGKELFRNGKPEPVAAIPRLLLVGGCSQSDLSRSLAQAVRKASRSD